MFDMTPYKFIYLVNLIVETRLWIFWGLLFAAYEKNYRTVLIICRSTSKMK